MSTRRTDVQNALGVEEVEHIIGKFMYRDVIQLAGTSGTLVIPGPRPSFRWFIDRISVVDDGGNLPVGAAANRFYIGAVSADSFVGGPNTSNAGGAPYSMQPIVLDSGPLIAVLSGWGANALVGINIGYTLIELEYRRWRRDAALGASSGFPQPPDAEWGTPAYDHPDAVTRGVRDGADEGGPGTEHTDRRGYGVGALYPDRPADATYPAPVPWPDGPAIPDGEY